MKAEKNVLQRIFNRNFQLIFGQLLNWMSTFEVSGSYAINEF